MEGSNNILHEHHIGDIFSALNIGFDDVDVPAAVPHISNTDIFFLISSILMHIIDMGFDINIAIQYLLRNKIEYFVWTVSFIFVPSLINVIISQRMQQQDRKLRSDEQEEHKVSRGIIKRRACCVMAIAFQLAPVLHYYDTLKYALKSRECKKKGDYTGQRLYYLKMLKEDQDVALLRVFECFLEAAPHQVLQITILLKNYHNAINFEFVHQVATIVSSLGSMGWAMASYNRSIRFAQRDKQNIGLTGSVLQFLWHFLVTVSRVLSITVLATVWPLYTAIGCVCHWIGMVIWIMADAHGILEFCRNNSRPPHMRPTITERSCSILFGAVIGIVHVFIYLNAVHGRTLFKHIFFYVLCFVENLLACVVWMFTTSKEVQTAWYFNVLIVFCIVPYLLGVTAMIVYYTVYHPAVTKRTNLKEQCQPM